MFKTSQNYFDSKPQPLKGYCIENTKQLMLF